MSKRFQAVLALTSSLVLCLAALIPATSLANGAKVSVAKGVTNIPAEVITDLENAYDPEDTITILSISGHPGNPGTGELPEDATEDDAAQSANDKAAAQNESSGETQTYFMACRYSDVVITTDQTNIASKDDFIFSAAKGETALLADAIKMNFTASVAGHASAGVLGLTESLQVTFPEGTIFVGPPEESSANSREYRVKFYLDKGSYKVKRENVYLPSLQEYIAGSWTAPAFCITYCIDRYIQ